MLLLPTSALSDTIVFLTEHPRESKCEAKLYHKCSNFQKTQHFSSTSELDALLLPSIVLDQTLLTAAVFWHYIKVMACIYTVVYPPENFIEARKGSNSTLHGIRGEHFAVDKKSKGLSGV